MQELLVPRIAFMRFRPSIAEQPASRSVVEPHSHPHEQMGLLLQGELTFTIGGNTKKILPGDMWRIPGGVVHGCVAGDMPTVAVDVFCPVRDDYR